MAVLAQKLQQEKLRLGKGSALKFHRPCSLSSAIQWKREKAPCAAQHWPEGCCLTCCEPQPPAQPCMLALIPLRREKRLASSGQAEDVSILISTAPVYEETLNTANEQSPKDIPVLQDSICTTACSHHSEQALLRSWALLTGAAWRASLQDCQTEKQGENIQQSGERSFAKASNKAAVELLPTEATL